MIETKQLLGALKDRKGPEKSQGARELEEAFDEIRAAVASGVLVLAKGQYSKPNRMGPTPNQGF